MGLRRGMLLLLAGIIAGTCVSSYLLESKLRQHTITNKALEEYNAFLMDGMRKMALDIRRHRQREEETSNGIKANGALAVRGVQLVNHHGKPLQLRGISSHGLAWFPEYINARALLTLKERGANVFRAAMYADSMHGGYNENETTRIRNKLYMFMAIENALAMDMYVIADWHILEDKNPLLTVDSAMDFFEELGYRYPNEPGIIYEICNEPNGDTTWEDIRQYAEKVIPVIRRHSPNAVILVGTPKFSSDLASVLSSPLDFDNIMYSYHLYTGMSDYDYMGAINPMREAGLPVFVSEWGLSTDAKTGTLDTDEARAFIEYMKKHRISWVNWSLANKVEDFSAIKGDVIKLSNWTDDDLTVSGKIIFDALSGE